MPATRRKRCTDLDQPVAYSRATAPLQQSVGSTPTPSRRREGRRKKMPGIAQQADSWTSQMRAEQSGMNLGAELGPADPTAFTQRRPIPQPMPLDRHGPARIIAMANQK